MTLVLILLLIFQAWAWYHMFQYPYMGLDVIINEDNQVTVDQADPNGGGAQLGIESEDIIVAINGETAGGYWTVQRFASVEQVNSMTILKNGDRIQLETKELSKWFLFDYVYVSAELISLALAFIIFKKVRATSSSLYLLFILLTVSVIFMSMGSSVRGDPLGKYLINAGILIMPLLIFHFVRAFMAEKAKMEIKTRLLKSGYGIVGILLVLMFTYFVNSPVTYPTYLVSKMGVMFAGLIGIVANVWLLVHLYVKNRKRNKAAAIVIKSISLALICAIAPIAILSFIPDVLFGNPWVHSLYTSSFLFLLPIWFIHLLATRRLYDIDQIIRRIIMIAVVSMIPSLLFTAVARLLPLQTVETEDLSLFFLIVWVSISFILYALEYINTRMEVVLFPRNYHLKQVLKKIARNLGTVSTIQDLKAVILTDIAETLELVGAAIILKDADGLDIIIVGDLEEQQVTKLVATPSEEFTNFNCFEIARQEQSISYLVVSEKKSGALLGLEDMNWLRLVLSYLAVAMENVQLIRKLDDKVQHLSALIPTEEEADQLLWFRKLLVDYQEQERVRLAMDLHDTTMQDLFFLKRNLQLTVEKNPVELKEHIHKLSDFIDRINQNLRQSCFELHPHLLKEIGLVGTLQKLFQVERKLNDFQIHFISSGDSEIEEQDMELKRNVFRMVQELLNNAKKYAKAANVRFSLILEDDIMYLEYMDDGVGFDPAKPVVREIGSNGMGIRQMKTRIMAMGGSCVLRSEVGKGVHFVAQFPIKDSHKGKNMQ